jgi:hypothetical protein
MLFDIDPTIGKVGGSVRTHAPVVNDPQIGRSRSIVPIVGRIDVDDSPKLVARMGGIAKATFFADYPSFVFNVCFAVGDFGLFFRPGLYADPHSHWFNVFIGYYQLDVPKATWNRPFAYEAAGARPAIRLEDIIRIGKADWNFFSNYMYGVPLDCIKPHNQVDLSTPCRNLGSHTIGSRFWDLVEIEEVKVVSGYESDSPGARKLVNNSILTPLWRRTFGLPRTRPDFPESFIRTDIRARLYLSFSEDAESYHTVIFGGTVNKSFPSSLNERFLDLQLTACRAIISRHYPHLGFTAA